MRNGFFAKLSCFLALTLFLSYFGLFCFRSVRMKSELVLMSIEFLSTFENCCLEIYSAYSMKLFVFVKVILGSLNLLSECYLLSSVSELFSSDGIGFY